MTEQRPRPVLLCILDGFGWRAPAPDNAITQASLAVWPRLWQSCPHALLEASGEAVGLPQGQMGNSEVGHMNLGAGRVVYQDLPLIDRSIASGEIETNPQLLSFVRALQASEGTCHLMGLASVGGVHAHQDHIVELARVVSSYGVPVHVHAFLDGRDVPPQSAASSIAQLEASIRSFANVQLVSLCGRYYAMDRDKRWERVERAFHLLQEGVGASHDSAVQAIQASYDAGIHDEFIEPVALKGAQPMRDGDGLLFANFRTDRAREIFTSLLDPAFDGFHRPRRVAFAAAVGMVDYADSLRPWMTALFPPKVIEDGLGEVVAKAGLHQLRIAETEKYPHVTFFFNGGREVPYPQETRILVPSPKVPTYDMQPEMAALEVTDKVVEAIDSGTFDFIVLNYANPDMVGHTGKLEAAIKAVETVDACLGRVLAALAHAGGAALITADHGNCESMYDEDTHGPQTAHTLSKVPVVLVDPTFKGALRDGRLADVAPTVLSLLGIEKPASMDGESLLEV